MARKPFYRTRRFWVDTGERVMRAFGGSGSTVLAQAVAGSLVAGWKGILVGLLTSPLQELLLCLKAGDIGTKGTAGFVKTEGKDGDG